MANVRKYAFDTEFGPDGAILRQGASVTKPLTPEDIEAANANGYENGKKDTAALAEREAAAALRDLANAASAILARLDAESKSMREEAARIALAASRKIAGAALDGFGAERVAAAIEAAMDSLRHQPRLVVKLSPEAAETLRPRIEAMCEAHAYAGAILVRAEPNMTPGQVSIDWSDGVVAHDPKEAAQRVEALIEAALAAEHSAS
jgi:flagellar assembly protein FliH